MSPVESLKNNWLRFVTFTSQNSVINTLKSSVSPSSLVVGLLFSGLGVLYWFSLNKEEKLIKESHIPDPEDDTPASLYKRQKREEHNERIAKEHLEKIIY